jgi:hypothetical protein
MRPEKWEKWGEMSEKVGICATESQKKNKIFKTFLLYISISIFIFYFFLFFFVIL